MPSLYEELGVHEDATQEEINAAYRKKAKKAHPDNKETGNEEEFKRLSHAVAILSDEDKRKQYDRTGSENTASPEERENAMALELLSRMFAQLFTMAEFDPALHSPLVAVKKLIKMEREAAHKAQRHIELVLNRMRKTIKRLTRKGKDVKAGKLSRVLDALEKQSLSELQSAETKQRVCNKALEILKEHDYVVDTPPPAKPKVSDATSGFSFFKHPSSDAAMKEAMEKLRAKIKEQSKGP